MAMSLEIPLLAEKEEIASLVREKRAIGEKLAAAGGADFSFFLEDCSDLADMIEEMREIKSKKGEKEHAAFETKIKFSRKIRRKAKDLSNFEQKLVREFGDGHIGLEHGRKMAAIAKLLRSGKADEAGREAKEFYGFLEMGERLRIISDLLAKKRAQVERAKRGVSAQLAGLEWLESQPEPDMEKTGRHAKRMRLCEEFLAARQSFIGSLQSMPLCSLLEKMHDDELSKHGFPAIGAQEAASLSTFLRRPGLESKSAGQLHEMAGESGQRLLHLGIDLHGFRREVAARNAFLRQIMSLQSSDFLADIRDGSAGLAYLSSQSREAAEAAEELQKLGSGAGEDEREWERRKNIEAKKAELAGAEKPALEKSLRGLLVLEGVLDGKAGAGEPQGGAARGRGMLESFFGFFRGK